MDLARIWAGRAATRNPVFPCEWQVHYQSGAIFRRCCRGRVRLTRQAPRRGIRALRVTGPGWVLEVPAVGTPDRIVAEASIVRQLPALTVGAVTGWRFGFRYADQFQGVTIDPAGVVTWRGVEPVPARGDARVCRGGLAPARPAGPSDTRGDARGLDAMT